jgi:hypothetical protein
MATDVGKTGIDVIGDVAAWSAAAPDFWTAE